MTKTLGYKLGMIAVLILLLLIPLLLINGLIDERQALRDNVLRDIAQSASFDQQLSAFLLRLGRQRRSLNREGWEWRAARSFRITRRGGWHP